MTRVSTLGSVKRRAQPTDGRRLRVRQWLAAATVFLLGGCGSGGVAKLPIQSHKEFMQKFQRNLHEQIQKSQKQVHCVSRSATGAEALRCAGLKP